MVIYPVGINLIEEQNISPKFKCAHIVYLAQAFTTNNTAHKSFDLWLFNTFDLLEVDSKMYKKLLPPDFKEICENII